MDLLLSFATLSNLQHSDIGDHISNSLPDIESSRINDLLKSLPLVTHNQSFPL